MQSRRYASLQLLIHGLHDILDVKSLHFASFEFIETETNLRPAALQFLLIGAELRNHSSSVIRPPPLLSTHQPGVKLAQVLSCVGRHGHGLLDHRIQPEWAGATGIGPRILLELTAAPV